MNIVDVTKKSSKYLFAGILLSSFTVLTVSAAVQELTAVFRPDSANPMNNKFENRTPQSGICPWHIPNKCKALNIFSIRTGDITFSSVSPIPANHENVRQGAMYKVPSEWRSLEVTEVDSGKIETVQMRIAGIGGRWDIARPPGVGAFGNLRSMWAVAPEPCESTGYIAAGTTLLLWFWIVPENAGICSRTALHDIPWLRYSNFEYAYELKTPNPLNMPTGRYKGSISYGIGSGKDIDFGDAVVPNDPELIFNFTLNVEHTLKVDVPPGGNLVELVPQGGWQSWLTQGRKPTRLFRDQTFNISASSPFKMNLECLHTEDGKNCALQDPVSGDLAPLEVRVSLPHGLTDSAGQSVNRKHLVLDDSNTEVFQPGFYVDRKPGTLHFEIPQENVGGMILPGQQRQYSGTVSVIWDSTI